jgi:hypothetical protein
MSTWAPGPFGNDAALNLSGTVVDSLMEHIDRFLQTPDAEGAFNQAFAALAILNEIIARTPTRPWDPEAGRSRDANEIVTALEKAFDRRSGDLDTPELNDARRQALQLECARFVLLMS